MISNKENGIRVIAKRYVIPQDRHIGTRCEIQYTGRGAHVKFIVGNVQVIRSFASIKMHSGGFGVNGVVCDFDVTNMARTAEKYPLALAVDEIIRYIQNSAKAGNINSIPCAIDGVILDDQASA
jgi:hypothetical protein